MYQSLYATAPLCPIASGRIPYVAAPPESMIIQREINRKNAELADREATLLEMCGEVQQIRRHLAVLWNAHASAMEREAWRPTTPESQRVPCPATPETPLKDRPLNALNLPAPTVSVNWADEEPTTIPMVSSTASPVETAKVTPETDSPIIPHRRNTQFSRRRNSQWSTDATQGTNKNSE